jgi:DNA repair and recombination protein RAD52
MKTIDEIQTALEKPLNNNFVEQRSDGRGGKLDYIPSWYAVALANKLFGADAWDRRTIEIEKQTFSSEGKTTRATATAVVEITVRYVDGVRGNSITVREITRQGTGQGQGFGSEAVGDAFKTAESDAMKRALMTFGDPFGLSLYPGDGDMQLDIPWFTPTERATLRSVVADVDIENEEARRVFEKAEAEQMTVEQTKELIRNTAEE